MIRLLCASADAFLNELDSTAVRAHLWHVDPPWDAYTQQAGQADPSRQYPTLTYSEIGSHIRQAGRLSHEGARLAEWQTWPLLEEIRRAPGSARAPWRYKTGGAWVKAPGHHGPGHHWSGISELVRVYSLPGLAYRDTSVPLRNGHVSRPTEHSEKPVHWLEEMVRRWVPPGGQVCELYAGLGSMAEAVVRAGGGRSYLGCEVDPRRHSRAMQRLGALGAA